MTVIDSKLSDAAARVRDASTLIILAGAGLSSEVGIPTYWSAGKDGETPRYGGQESKQGYTALQHANATLWIQDTGAQVEYFDDKRAELAAIDFSSSIYGDLLKLAEGKDYFCVTSNTDCGFYRAGFDEDRLFEVHGSHRACQCIMDGAHGVFPVTAGVDSVCRVCALPARPNVLFFNDRDFNPRILFEQQDRFNRFVDRTEGLGEGVALLEFGVGTTVPRVRQIANRLYRDYRGPDFVHVNLEPEPEFLFAESCGFENRERWLQMSAADFINAL